MIYRTFWPRVAAFFFDNMLLIPLMVMQNNTPEAGLSPAAILILALQHSYFIIGHAQYGQTLGKRLLGLRVVLAHEHWAVGWLHAILRESISIAVSIFYSMPVIERAITSSTSWALIPGAVITLANALV